MQHIQINIFNGELESILKDKHRVKSKLEDMKGLFST